MVTNNDKKPTITAKQHYVPQFYLRQWCDEDDGFYPIKIENRTPPKFSVFKNKSGPSSFCFENFFYAQYTGVKDEISQVIEKTFAEAEAVLDTQLLKIEQKIINHEQITDIDKYNLCECALFFHFRGKKYRQESQRMTESLVKQINKHLVRHMDKDPKTKAEMDEHGVTKEQMIDFAEKGEYSVELGNIHHLQIMNDMQGFCNLLFAKYWKVYISRDNDFIVTDTPYLDLATSQHFFGNDFLSREQSFVLSPRVTIVMLYPQNDSGKKFSREDITGNKRKVQTLNTHRLVNSVMFGFHKDKKVLDTLNIFAEFLHRTFRTPVR